MTIDLSIYIRPGDGVTWGQACSEPLTLTEAFVAQRAAYTGARVFLGVNYSGVVQAAHADHLKLASYCGAGHNRKLADAVKKTRAETVEGRLKDRIVDGDRKGLGDELDEALKTNAPLDIINNILLDGMKVVGELFGAGKMQLPFVLQSAETMKAAVAHRRAYDPIAARMFWVDTPGPCSSNLKTLPYKHIRRPIYPLD